MSTEWSISFNYRMTGVVAGWSNIIHFTINGDVGLIGDRTPAVFTRPGSPLIHFVSAINATNKHEVNAHEGFQQNRVYKIEVHQRYISNGNYRYFIKIDGEEIHSAINSNAKQFYNVKVYAANPWYNASKGLISNFQFTNFL